MMARVWTKAQKDAISARDGTLLVSAAAGSGKTAVLVQRVIERLIDPDHPCDADRLLVVTFTNAAAAEMRQRIAEAIDRMLEEDPGNTRLQRQQILLPQAHISTIHSFCSELVREHFYQLGISPDFRISDSNEMDLLREEAMQQVMEDLYEQGEEDFRRLSDCFSNGRDDRRLFRLVNTLYDFVRSHPFPERWLEEKAAMYHPEGDAAHTLWGQTVLEYADSAILYAITLTQNALDLMEQDPKLDAAYRPAFSSDLAGLLSLQEAAQAKQWDTLSQRIRQFSFEKLKAVRGYKDDPLKGKISGNRDTVKKTLEKLSALFFASDEQCLEDIRRMAPIIERLLSAVKRFGDVLDACKAARRIADFGDLEHWALRLLVRPTQAGFVCTEVAQELSLQFDEVMVDEYQDTNEAQDMIFRAVSQQENNLFMVGDVKQSIYRFRQAMPEIFLRRKEAYPAYDDEKKEYPAKVILDKNFRSRSGVTGAVNFVFRQLMSRQMGEMAYSQEEELVPGADYPPRDIPDVSLHILDLSCEEEQDMDVAEAGYIAGIISQMIENKFPVTENGRQRPVTYRDFCILIRNANNHAGVYAKELQLHGIPAWSDAAGAFFGTPEISVLLSFLRVIDNPVQDIPLLSILMSPIFGWSPDRLTEIRLGRQDGPLYFAVKQEAERGDESCKNFLRQMEEYRRLAAALPADRLIHHLYEQTGFLAMVQAMPEGELRLANLRLMMEYARTYEQSGYKGLSGFIRFIDRLEQQQSDLAPASILSESANVVRIMSIHRSKGLEFPVCILANCSRLFNKDRGEVLLHPTLGVGMKLWDDAMIRRYPTMPREAVALEIERAGMSEELRVLYVAMTRAKENLMMVTSLKNPARTLGKLAAQLSEAPEISPYVVRSASCFSDWILSCALRHPSGAKLREMAGALPGLMRPDENQWEIILGYPEGDFHQESAAAEEPNGPYDENLYEIWKTRLEYRYPAQELTGVPVKAAASELAGRQAHKEYAFTSRPAFLESQGMTAAEKGTALHAFIQFADYAKAAEDLSQELHRLVEKKFLTEEQAKAVDEKQAAGFFNSSLMKRMLRSPNLLREYRFTIWIPASDIQPEIPDAQAREPVLLQGAIDCAFEEDEGWVLVDYKTDRVKTADELAARYAAQLDLYAKALARCTGKPVRQRLLYSFVLGEAIALEGGL